MHFVTGGAFNGKGKWVYRFYNLNQRKDWFWYNNYKQIMSEFTPNNNNSLIIVSGIELLIKDFLHKQGEGNTRKTYMKFLDEAISWEKQNKNHQLVLIGNDVTKGIVPMNKDERLWRDFVGWCYQDTVKEADRVDIVWYGIASNLKLRV